MKYIPSNKWILASILMSSALYGMNNDLNSEELKEIQERLAQTALPIIVQSEEFTLELKKSESAASPAAAQPAINDTPSTESTESNSDVSTTQYYDAPSLSPVPVRPPLLHRKAASFSVEAGTAGIKSLENKITDSKPSTAPVSPLSSPHSEGSTSSIPSPRPPTPPSQDVSSVNPTKFDEIKSVLDKLPFAELSEYAKSFPHLEPLKEYVKNRHIAELARVEKNLTATNPDRSSTPVPSPQHSLEIESINRTSTVPTIDFKASDMTLPQLKEIDPASLTPRTRDSLAARIEFLEVRAKGPVSGDPKGEIVDDGFMQRVWTNPEATAERARIAATRSSDAPAGRPVVQEIPAESPGESPRFDLKNEVPANKNNPSCEGSRLTTVLEIAGIALVAWTTAEAIFAYKNISKADWDNAKQLHNKIDLLARKTGNAMVSRPGQAVTFASQLINKILPNRAKKSS